MVSFFIEWPLVAAGPGLLFLGLYRRSPDRWILVAGVAWLLYALYELGMRWRWLCSGECNIRVDLLLIYPLLVVASVLGLVAAARHRATNG